MHETSHQAFNRLSLALLLAVVFAVVLIANIEQDMSPADAAPPAATAQEPL